jgi:succinate dehydrogenase/fumarate reductase flavoprotein subunit
MAAVAFAKFTGLLVPWFSEKHVLLTVLGLKVRVKDQTKNFKAKKAVILTCGGFENNPQMIRDYLGVSEVAPFGTPYNTGDGIKMALKVGANLWHMSAQSGMWASFKIPESAAFVCRSERHFGGRHFNKIEQWK